MRLPRFMLLSLLISLCAATVAAQSSQQTPSPPLQPAPQNAQSDADLFPFPFTLDGLSLSPATAAAKDDSHALDSTIHLAADPLEARGQHILTLEQEQATCYTIRAYRVARITPNSDTTKPAGYSTCQPASRIQLKTAVDSREIAP